MRLSAWDVFRAPGDFEDSGIWNHYVLGCLFVCFQFQCSECCSLYVWSISYRTNLMVYTNVFWHFKVDAHCSHVDTAQVNIHYWWILYLAADALCQCDTFYRRLLKTEKLCGTFLLFFISLSVGHRLLFSSKSLQNIMWPEAENRFHQRGQNEWDGSHFRVIYRPVSNSRLSAGQASIDLFRCSEVWGCIKKRSTPWTTSIIVKC